MNIVRTEIPDVLIFEPKVFGDARGFFFESFNQRRFEELTGLAPQFVQDNHSRSARGVLRGLHYQVEQAQGKLVRVTAGEVFDVCVDLRRSSPTFGKSVSVMLSADNHRQFWIPPGFAHGFVVLSETATFFYKVDKFYEPGNEVGIMYNDKDLNIDWRLTDAEIILSEKDKTLGSFAEYAASL